MHEWALAEAVIESAIKFTDKQIKHICIVLGEIQQIDIEILDFALNNYKTLHNKTKNAVIDFETESGILRCNVCNNEWNFRSKESYNENVHFIPEFAHAFIHCPKCKSQDFKIVSGRGIYIKYIN